MVHTRRHMTEDTKKALAKAKRLISKLGYEEFSKAKEIENQVYEEFKSNEWFEQLTYTDKMYEWIKEAKYNAWVKYLEEVK